jgi:hypothetical protein
MIIQKLTLEELQVKIQKGKKYKQLLEAFQTNRLYNINLDEYKEEITALHRARSIRTLINFCNDKAATSMVDEVIRANLTDQAQRGRLTEILLTCVRASNALNEAISVFKDFALIRYDSYLTKIKTKGERATFLDTLLSDMQTYSADCELVINLAKLVIADIDQGGWALSRTIEALKITNAPEKRI